MKPRAEQWKQVTADDFFTALYADPRDIMPRWNRDGTASLWEDKNGDVWGKTTPGWKCERPKEYFLRVNPGGNHAHHT